MTRQAPPVRLSQTAPWNPALTNPYRTRYAEAGGRYFKVHSDRLDGVWIVDEITAAGDFVDAAGFPGIAFRLSEAREIIAAAIEQAGASDD